MADTKITALAAITTVDPAADVLPIVDISDTSMAASGTTKKITSNQILGAGGTATLASATITGDLTVRTNKLAVTSTGVGIGTTSPSTALDVFGGNIRLVGGNIFQLLNTANDANVDISNNGSTGVASMLFKVAGTSAMTLNATGLGVGVSPGVGFDLQQTSPMVRITGTSTTGYSSLTLRNTGASGRQYGLTLGGSGTGTNAGNLVITDDTASATRFVLDSSGNVGISVTPITSHILSCSGPVGIAGTNAGTRTSYISNANACSIYYTDGGGSGYFTDFGNLIIQPRTSAARSVVIATGSTTPVERAVVKSTGQVRFVPLAADPAGAESGDVYYNSSSNKLKCYNGTTWNDLF